MTDPIRIKLPCTQNIPGAGTTDAIATGGTPGVSAAYALHPGTWQGFPGVWVKQRRGVHFFPLTALDRVDFDEDALPPEAVEATGLPTGYDVEPSGNVATEPPATSSTETEDAGELESMTVADLRRLAAGKVEGYSTMKKAELVEALSG